MKIQRYARTKEEKLTIFEQVIKLKKISDSKQT